MHFSWPLILITFWSVKKFIEYFVSSSNLKIQIPTQLSVDLFNAIWMLLTFLYKFCLLGPRSLLTRHGEWYDTSSKGINIRGLRQEDG